MRRRPFVLVAAAVGVLAVVTSLVWVLLPGNNGGDNPGAVAATGGGGPSATNAGPGLTATPSNGARPTPAATTPKPAATRTTTSQPPARGSKKGVSTWDFAGVGPALTDVRASWYYNWSANPTANAGRSAEFVPMIWGKGSVTVSNLGHAKAAGTTILGFNEPDLGSQSNMSVEDALALWPQLQATGKRLGSPAVAYGGDTPGGWLDRFMSGARSRGLRVDFITLHWYGSDFGPNAPGQLAGYVKAVYDRYHLPIWLTEFALIKFGSGGSTYPTAAQQVAFVQGATARLNAASYVERFAWFALPTSDKGDGTGLYRNGTTPTAVGVAYRAVP